MIDREDEGGRLSVTPPPMPRRRSLTLESHSKPSQGTSLGRNLELRRQSITPDHSPGYVSPAISTAELQSIIHSSLAGNLCYHTSKPRRCFVDYGFVNHALEVMMVSKFGEEVWDDIRLLADAKVTSPFIVRMIYDNNMAYNIVEAAAEVTGLSQNALWEMFGEMFFEFCEESGYDKIIRVLGGTLRDFLQNLDALHDHLSSIYPGMRAPSFRVTQRDDGSIILHYYSERQGLEHVVIGLVRTVARKLHNKEVNVEIISTQGEYVQFLITEKSNNNTDDTVTDDSDDEVELLSTEPRVSPATFCKAFPFHIMMTSDLRIVQAGSSVSRVITELDDPSYTFRDIFQVIRPQIELNFENIIAHANAVFIVRARDRIRLSPRRSVGNAQSAFQGCSGFRLNLPMSSGSCTDENDITHRKRMCLKGQMLYVAESDKIVFLCSPSVGNLEDLVERGLYLSDIPLHDSTRDLVLLSEQFRAEYKLTQKLEVMNDKLQQTYRELEIEKQLTDKLVYSILPPTVADKLRMGQPVEAVKYDSVSILFSGICEFNRFCTNNSPMMVVNMLNELYTKFDALADPRIYNVYKVETVGDKYMLAAGLPERSTTHARNIALVALDMIDLAREMDIDGSPVKITIGIHSGDVVAGVVGQKLPRYAVFGSTVCLASRMESTGLPDCINISGATHHLLNTKECMDDQFLFRSRGDVYVKGMRTPMRCHLLSRNLSKVAKVQMLLESGLIVGAGTPSPTCSPSDGGDPAGWSHANSGRRKSTSPCATMAKRPSEVGVMLRPLANHHHAVTSLAGGYDAGRTGGLTGLRADAGGRSGAACRRRGSLIGAAVDSALSAGATGSADTAAGTLHRRASLTVPDSTAMTLLHAANKLSALVIGSRKTLKP